MIFFNFNGDLKELACFLKTISLKERKVRLMIRKLYIFREDIAYFFIIYINIYK